jgi:hypothetical protein
MVLRIVNASFESWRSFIRVVLCLLSSLALVSFRPSPRGDNLRGKVHTGDTQLRRSGTRAYAS